MISSSTQETGSSSSKNKSGTPSTNIGQSDEAQQEFQELINKWRLLDFAASSIPSLVQDVNSTDTKERHHGVIGLRKLLSAGDHPPIQKVLDSGVLPTLIKLVKDSSESNIQLEAAWCLANLCSGTDEQTQEVVDKGGVVSFLTTLKSSNEEIIEQGLWGLANIAGTSIDHRDLLIEAGVIELLEKILKDAKSWAVKKNGTWTFSNLYRKPEPAYEEIESTIPLLCNYLKNEGDMEILEHVSWSLSYISKKDEALQPILSQNVGSRLVELLDNSPSSVYAPCLRVVGNIISGTDEQAAILLKEKSLLPSLLKMLDHESKPIRKEILWILSNIAAGPPAVFESVMGNSAFVQKIIHAARSDDVDVSREAAYILSNSTETCTPAQIIRLLNNGVYSCLIELLDSGDEKTLLVALEGIKNCLKWGDEFKLKDESGGNKFVVRLESNGGFNKLESLQAHPNNEVYEIVTKIIDEYIEF